MPLGGNKAGISPEEEQGHYNEILKIISEWVLSVDHALYRPLHVIPAVGILYDAYLNPNACDLISESPKKTTNSFRKHYGVFPSTVHQHM